MPTKTPWYFSMRKPFGYRPDLCKEVDLVVLKPEFKWGRLQAGSRTRFMKSLRPGHAFIVAYTVDSAGRSMRFLYQRATDHRAYGDHNWPTEARQVADLVPGVEAPRRKPECAE